MAESLHAVVSGLVQGVGFRYYVLREATSLGLRGYARNLASGEVEVVAEGERAALDALLARLRVGPRSAMVRDVRLEAPAADVRSTNFEIR